MFTIKEVIQLALHNYGKRSFMCHRVEDLVINRDDIDKTLNFIRSQLAGAFTLNSFLIENSPEYEALCDSESASYEGDKPHGYRVKWWNEIIELPEAQV